jgi:hypothetical protein
MPRPCQSTGVGPRSSRWSPHGGVPGRSHPQGSALAVPRPTPNNPATPIPAAIADADTARLKDISSLRFSSMRQYLPRGVTLRCGHCMALCWQCARAVQAVTDRQPFAINGIEKAARPVRPGGLARRGRATSRCHRKSNGCTPFRWSFGPFRTTPAGEWAWTWPAHTAGRPH